MHINMIGSFVRNHPFGSEIAYKKGLEQLGHTVGTWDPSAGPFRDAYNWSDSPDAVIMFKDHGEVSREVMATFKSRGVPSIEYQPDDIRAPGIKDMMKRMRECCDYAFTFDKSGAEVCRGELGYLRAKKLQLTADPDLYRPIPSVNRDIDLCFVGCLSNPVMHESRRHMCNVLRDAGFNVVAVTEFDVRVVNMLYNRSKIVVNHACDVGQPFGYGYGLQCRHFEAGLAGTCLLSNRLLDDEGDGPKQFCTFSDEVSLLDMTHVLLEIEYSGRPLWQAQAEEYIKELRANFLPTHRAADIINFIEEIR